MFWRTIIRGIGLAIGAMLGYILFCLIAAGIVSILFALVNMGK